MFHHLYETIARGGPKAILLGRGQGNFLPTKYRGWRVVKANCIIFLTNLQH